LRFLEVFGLEVWKFLDWNNFGSCCFFAFFWKFFLEVFGRFFWNNFLLGYAKNAYNQRGFSKRYLHNNHLTKANADNEAIHNAFSIGWL